jgi:hypothetical protein
VTAIDLDLGFLEQAIDDDWQQIASFLAGKAGGDRLHR